MIRTAQIEIDGKQYIIRPLTGKYIGKLFTVMKSMSKIKEGSSPEEIFSVINEDTATALHELIYATLQKANTGMNPEELDEYVTQDMFKLMGKILEINMPKQ